MNVVCRKRSPSSSSSSGPRTDDKLPVSEAMYSNYDNNNNNSEDEDLSSDDWGFFDTLMLEEGELTTFAPLMPVVDSPPPSPPPIPPPFDVMHRIGALEALLAQACKVFNVPSACVTVLCGSHLWVAACVTSSNAVNVALNSTRWIPAKSTICWEAMVAASGPPAPGARTTFVVNDTADPRNANIANLPCVLDGPKVKFYAGAPLRSGDHILGMLAIFDSPDEIDSVNEGYYGISSNNAEEEYGNGQHANNEDDYYGEYGNNNEQEEGPYSAPPHQQQTRQVRNRISLAEEMILKHMANAVIESNLLASPLPLSAWDSLSNP